MFCQSRLTDRVAAATTWTSMKRVPTAFRSLKVGIELPTMSLFNLLSIPFLHGAWRAVTQDVTPTRPSLSLHFRRGLTTHPALRPNLDGGNVDGAPQHGAVALVRIYVFWLVRCITVQCAALVLSRFGSSSSSDLFRVSQSVSRLEYGARTAEDEEGEDSAGSSVASPAGEAAALGCSLVTYLYTFLA